MNASARLGAYVLVLVVVFVLAALAGRAVGPMDDPAPEHPSEHGAGALTVRAGSA